MAVGLTTPHDEALGEAAGVPAAAGRGDGLGKRGSHQEPAGGGGGGGDGRASDDSASDDSASDRGGGTPGDGGGCGSGDRGNDGQSTPPPGTGRAVGKSGGGGVERSGIAGREHVQDWAGGGGGEGRTRHQSGGGKGSCCRRCMCTVAHCAQEGAGWRAVGKPGRVGTRSRKGATRVTALAPPDSTPLVERTHCHLAATEEGSLPSARWDSGGGGNPRGDRPRRVVSARLWRRGRPATSDSKARWGDPPPHAPRRKVGHPRQRAVGGVAGGHPAG